MTARPPGARRWPCLLALLTLAPGAAAQEAKEPAPPKKLEVLQLTAHARYHTVAFSPDGRHVAAAGPGREVKVWDRNSGKELFSLLGHRSEVIDVAFSPDGRLLASSAQDGLRVWRLASGSEIFAVTNNGWVSRLAFSPDGKLLAAGGAGIVRVWDVTTTREIHALKGTGSQTCVAFHPDGRVLAASGDNRVRLWDVCGGRELSVLQGHRSSVHTVAFSPDGKRLASASLDRTVKLWDTATGAVLHTFEGHTSGVHTVAFSPDGGRLATSSADGTVKLWELRTGKELLTLRGHTGPVYSVAWCPAGRHVASTGSDASVRLWSVGVFRPEPVRLTALELRESWVELLDEPTVPAFRATFRLAAAPQQTVAFLKERLRPAQMSAAEAKRLGQLLAALDDNRFPVRQRATEELERMGKSAEPALREALQRRPSLEMLRRLERLVERLQEAEQTPEQRLAERAVEVLVRIDTPEARELLKALAAGAPQSWLTHEARQGLRRLRRP